MPKEIDVGTIWQVSVKGFGEFEAKVIMVAPKMVGLKSGLQTPQYFAPEEIKWLKKV